MRITENELIYLKEKTKESRLKSISSFIRNQVLQDFSENHLLIPTETELRKSERRSIFITNKIWFEVIDKCHRRCSISEFVIQTILEKIERSNLNKF